MKIKTLLFSLGFVLLFYCCSSGDVVKPQDPELPDTTKPANTINDGLIPLAKGNYWYYKPFYDPDLDTMKISIDDEIKIKFEQELIPVYIQSNNGFKWFNRNFEDGYYQIGACNQTDTLIRKDLLYKYPVKLNQSWIQKITAYDFIDQKYKYIDSMTVTCVDTALIYTTPLGEFKTICYHYRRKPDPEMLAEYDYYIYIMPNVGIVGRKLVDVKFDRISVEWKLVNYHLN